MGKRSLIIAVLVCALAASCFVIGQRARVESANRGVEIVVDYGEAEQIAATTGRDVADVLKTFERAGAVGVAIAEQTVGDLIESREMIPYGEHQFALREPLAQRVGSRLQSALARGKDRVKLTILPGSQMSYLTVSDDVPLSYLEQIPVGLPEKALTATHHAGLEAVARLLNYPGVNQIAIESEFENLKSMGIGKVIFQGDQVLGFKGGVKYTADALKKTGIVFGRVEFSKQKGEMELAEKAPANVLIVHSITQLEMPALDQGSIVERFQRAARERGVRVCYVRMYNTSSNNLVGSNADYLSKIAKSLMQAGFGMRSAVPMQDVTVPLGIRMVAGAGAGAAAALLILSVIDLSVVATILWGAGLILACAGLAALGNTGRGIAALIAAISFPTLGAIYAIGSCPESPTGAAKPVLRALGRVLAAVVITAIGGAIVAGLLSERSYMLRSHQFLGVKLAHLIPVLIMALLLGGGIAWAGDTWTEQKRRLCDKFRQIAANPMLMWQAGIAAVMLVVVGFMVARSGNDPGVGVSGLELEIRAILDKLLYVRPRTKEFLIGYPALLVGVAFALRGFRTIAAPLVVVGTIALVSALNSFCHVHTPLLLSAIRVINGAIFGCAIGIVVYWLVKDIPGRTQRSPKEK